MQNAKTADVFDLAQLDSQIREAARKYRLTEDERDELRQESAVLILERQQELEAAIWNVVVRAARRIRRNRYGPKRRTLCIDWLDENDPALIVSETDPETNCELQEVMQMMSADLRAICERLMYETPRSAARRLKMSPGTLRRKMQEIGKWLADWRSEHRERIFHNVAAATIRSRTLRPKEDGNDG